MFSVKNVVNVLIILSVCCDYRCYCLVKFSNKLANINILFNNKLSATLTGIESDKIVICEGNNSKYCYKIDEDQRLLIDEDVDNWNGNDVKCSRTCWINSPDLKEMCFDLGKDEWYGGGNDNYWNLKKSSSRRRSAYYTGDPLGGKYGQSVIEPVWISSSGMGILVDRDTPLFMRYDEKENGTLCFSASYDEFPFNSSDKKPDEKNLKVTVCEAMDVKEMALYAINTWLGRPSALPDLSMMTEPIWSTQGLPKHIYGSMNQTKLIEFAHQILDEKYDKSQIEIDIGWQECIGLLDFDRNKYPDPKKMINDLEKLGFRLTVWLNGFVSIKCQKAFDEGLKNGYFVKLGKTGQPLIHNGFAFIDLTNPSAEEWLTKKLEYLKSEYGVFSLKFDDGEISPWLIPGFRLFNQTLQEKNPSLLSKAYAETIFKASGNSAELRIGFNSQNLPVFMRMFDKTLNWTAQNGIKSMIPNALLFSLYGYPFILPDIIDDYNYESNSRDYSQILADRELFIRWVEASALLPVIEFAIPPWIYNDSQVLEISARMTKLHQSFSSTFEELSEQSKEFGFPLIRPLWWEDPRDEVTFTIDDQFMLGDEIMIAPILEANARQRNIYLTKGNWIDENLGQFYVGPVWLNNYSVELDVLPYFRKGQCNPCNELSDF